MALLRTAVALVVRRRAPAAWQVQKEKEDAIRAKIRADRAAKEQADRDREDREKARREKLQRELSASAGDAEGPRKKKKKKGGAPTLSFDAEEEDT